MVAVGKTKLLLGGLCFFSQHIEVLLHACVVVHNLSLHPLWDKQSPVQQIFMMMAILILSICSLPVECLYEATDFVQGFKVLTLVVGNTSSTRSILDKR